MDDAVGLQHVSDGDHGDVTLGVGDRELAGAGLLHDQVLAGDGFEVRFTLAVLTPEGHALAIKAAPVHVEHVRHLIFNTLDETEQHALRGAVWGLVVPSDASKVFPERSLSTEKLIQWLTTPDGRLGADLFAARDELLKKSLAQASSGLERRLGADMTKWRYGQEALKHIRLRHPLSDAVTAEIRSRPPVLLIHGDADELIPVQALLHAAQGLAALEVPAEWHIAAGIGHGIDQEGLRQGGEFLAKSFARRK